MKCFAYVTLMLVGVLTFCGCDESGGNGSGSRTSSRRPFGRSQYAGRQPFSSPDGSGRRSFGDHTPPPRRASRSSSSRATARSRRNRATQQVTAQNKRKDQPLSGQAAPQAQAALNERAASLGKVREDLQELRDMSLELEKRLLKAKLNKSSQTPKERTEQQ